MTRVSLVLLFIFCAPSMALSNPCPTTQLIPSIAPIEPQVLLNQILRLARLKDEKGEAIQLSADTVTIQDGIMTLENPRLNGSRIFSQELFCTTFGTSLFGNQICLKSDSRGMEQALCRSLGLEPVGSEAFYTNSRESRKLFYYHENQWQEDSTRMPGNPNYQLQALLRFSCRL